MKQNNNCKMLQVVQMLQKKKQNVENQNNLKNSVKSMVVKQDIMNKLTMMKQEYVLNVDDDHLTFNNF